MAPIKLSNKASIESIDGLQVRVMKPEELELLPRFWIQDVGIPIELRFIRRWFLLDPEGFRVVVNAQGRLIGMASILKQTENLYVMGYMGVAKEYRSKGIGRKLLENLLSRSPKANYVLSASEDKLDAYLRRGFKRVDECSGFSYIGKFTVSKHKSRMPNTLEVHQVKPGEPLLAEVIEYDAGVCGFKRNFELIQFSEPSSVVLAIKREGKVVAYGKMEKYMLNGAWLGPVYGDDFTVSSYLIDALMRRFESERCPFVFGIFSAKAQSIAKVLNLKLADKLARCCLSESPSTLPNVKMENVYAFDDIGFAFL